MREHSSNADYEREHERILKENRGRVAAFEAWMKSKGLSQRTMNKHADNVQFFLDEYLLNRNGVEMEEGCYDIGGFLGDFFIYKCTWSTPNSIKENATSIKKFYKCMLELGAIRRESYDTLVQTIKGCLPMWQEDCREYNDPAYDPYSFDDVFDEELYNFILDATARRLGLGDLDVTGGGSEGKAEGSGAASGGDMAGASAMGASNVLQPDFGGASKPSSSEPPEIAAHVVGQPSRELVLGMFTLMLFYLTSWEERPFGKGGPIVHRAWKSADWDTLDLLRELGFVDCSNKAKSVTLTDDGVEEATALLNDMGLGHLV